MDSFLNLSFFPDKSIKKEAEFLYYKKEDIMSESERDEIFDDEMSSLSKAVSHVHLESPNAKFTNTADIAREEIQLMKTLDWTLAMATVVKYASATSSAIHIMAVKLIEEFGKEVELIKQQKDVIKATALLYFSPQDQQKVQSANALKHQRAYGSEDVKNVRQLARNVNTKLD